MNITGVTLDEFKAITARVSDKHYAGNVKVQNDSHDNGGVKRPRITARLDIVSTGSREGLPTNQTLPGTRRSAGYGQNKRRIHAACWHAYRDVLTAVFDAHPDAVIRTAMAKYDGKDGFERNYPLTGDQNIGSMVQPMCAADACDCEDD